MPRKKKATSSKSKAVAKRGDNLPTDWKSQLKGLAKAESERVPVNSGSKITLRRNGKFSFQGTDIGTSIDIVILDHTRWNAYYNTPYDEDNPSPPACFAIHPTLKGMAPHETSPEKQSEVCEGCWANEWGSSAREGNRGKACGNKVRMAVLHAEQLDGEIAVLEIPVTSVNAFNKYVKQLNEAAQLPSFAVVTTLSMDPDADYQVLEFELKEQLDDDSAFTCYERVESGTKMITTAPDVSGFVGDSKSKKKAGKKASKKKASKKKSSKKATGNKRGRFS